MAHLLFIECWKDSRALPVEIRRLGHRYTFVARNISHYMNPVTKLVHPIFEYADNVLTADTNDVPGLVDFLRRQHEILHFDGVLTNMDYYLDAVAEVAQALGLPQAGSS